MQATHCCDNMMQRGLAQVTTANTYASMPRSPGQLQEQIDTQTRTEHTRKRATREPCGSPNLLKLTKQVGGLMHTQPLELCERSAAPTASTLGCVGHHTQSVHKCPVCMQRGEGGCQRHCSCARKSSTWETHQHAQQFHHWHRRALTQSPLV